MTPFHAAFLTKLVKEGVVAEYADPLRKVSGVDPYFYNATYSDLDNGLAQSAQIPTQADSDFLATSISAGVREGGGRVNMPLVLWQITDLSDGGTFFNTPLVTRLAFGDFGFPGVFTVPRLLRANAVIQVDLDPLITDYDDAWISIHGIRIIYEGAA